MTAGNEQIDLTELRERAERSDADSFVHGISLWVSVPTIVALVEAVEAAQAVDEQQPMPDVGKPGFAARTRLRRQLARFSFGPSPAGSPDTKGA